MAVLIAGCEGQQSMGLQSMPDLAFGGPKADGPSTNTTLGNRLLPGTALSGKHTGFMAFPMEAEAGEFIPVQAWTSEASVVFIFGPRQGRDWDFEQVRVWSEDVKPGVETRRLNFEAPEAGEYLVVVGALDARESDWIVARGAPPTH